MSSTTIRPCRPLDYKPRVIPRVYLPTCGICQKPCFENDFKNCEKCTQNWCKKCDKNIPKCPYCRKEINGREKQIITQTVRNLLWYYESSDDDASETSETSELSEPELSPEVSETSELSEPELSPEVSEDETSETSELSEPDDDVTDADLYRIY